MEIRNTDGTVHVVFLRLAVDTDRMQINFLLVTIEL